MRKGETIKRENINHKYFIVVRDHKGKQVSRRQWKKGFTLHKAKSVYAQTKTLYTDKTRDVTSFKNFDMITQPYSNKAPYSHKYMVECEIQSKNIHDKNITVVGRSSYKTVSQDGKRAAKEEAFENAVLRWHNQYYGSSGTDGDFTDARELFDKLKPTITYRTVYFRQKNV